ncbi:YsnF/AvaK domain-containing protein [Massilia soli]|uniref:YsnF/AvaK domain-containing protein n=1 Tax=Massilia soli TaxID=2792854 RepID=A0ABS7SUR8_9BURK|nr:YsnF/AvaK domain-containing protein [Massilia soli]MBZ2209696.1 YsnF/AvaK domain-containing protein [Massilia soli]
MTGESKSAGASTARLTVPVHQEELHVGVRTVDTGRGVRVHKTVGEHGQLIEETLMHDEIDVRHVPVDKIIALSDAPASRYEGDTLIVPVLEEILVVEKRLRIKEEIHITRSKRPQRFSETVVVKSETAAVERFDEGPDVPGNDLHG